MTHPTPPLNDPPITISALLADRVTQLSLASTLAILLSAYTVSTLALTPRTPGKLRTIFIWHLFDLLIHFILEGSFVYHSLFSYASPEQLLAAPEFIQALPWPVAGAWFSDAPMAKLWQVYAKADLRWGFGEPNIVAMELLTVIGAGGLASYVVWLIIRDERWAAAVAVGKGAGGEGASRPNLKQKWFWMTVLAVGELYGGFMTFVPEWLIGSPMLITSNWVYKWLYLFFFNMLWVIIPVWVIWEGYWELMGQGGVDRVVESKVVVEKKRL